MSRLYSYGLHGSFLVSLLLGALCTGGCRKKQEEAPQVSVSVQVTHPAEGPISEEIEADAVLAPLSQAALAPRASAPITAEYVQRGSHVRRGQLLVSLEDRDLQGGALESRGALTAAQAAYTTALEATIPEEIKRAQVDVDQSKAALDVASRTASERRRLFSEGALSGRDADTAFAAAAQAQASFDNAQKHLDAVLKTTRRTNAEAAQGALTSARGRLENTQAQLAYANLRSPIDGVVTDRPLFRGEMAAAGSPVVTIMDTSVLLAKVHLAQSTSQKLSIGHKAFVSVPGMDEPVEASVSLISPALDTGSTTVEVWLKLPNSDGHLKVGTPVHVEISGNTVKMAVLIPPAAILAIPGGGNAVMVVDAENTARKRSVTVGVRTDKAVQILSGLSPADTVITTGGYGLDDGTRIRIVKAGAAEDKD